MSSEDGNTPAPVAVVSQPSPVGVRPAETVQQVKEHAEAAYKWFGEMYMTVIWNTVIANLILLAITLLAVFLYGSLYYTYIPRSMQSKQLFFQRAQVLKVRTDIHVFSHWQTSKLLQFFHCTFSVF